MVRAVTEKELGRALKNREAHIEVVGDLSEKVYKIKTVNPDAWKRCVSALGVAATAAIATAGTAGLAAPLAIPSTLLATPAIVSALGVQPAISAVTIAVAGESIDVLNALRKYDMEKVTDGSIILYKR